ncbi:MAG: PKD domain-containing protein [Bacteroidales bacterium]|nr:PKD domain-containing protein [Bacteroidales bacterium]MBN2819946.1 PKD domain-containing protein [Bacteroidales bacterium]
MTIRLNKVFALLISAFCVVFVDTYRVYGQATASIVNIGDATISIDGNSGDLAWAKAIAVEIDQPFQSEVPTLNSATWKALWDTTGIYFLIEVSDDIWLPSWVSGLNSWESDKVELWIDVTKPQKDGGGGSGANGNHSVAPDFTQNSPGTVQTYNSLGVIYADTYNGTGNYCIEYYVPFAAIPDNYSNIIDPRIDTIIGFDVTVIDLDNVSTGRNRAVWSNIGDINESWVIMDDVGLIKFSNEDAGLSAWFTASNTTVGPGKTVIFTDLSNGNPTSWEWSFGDGSTSAEQNPEHSYASLGYYTVSLTVSDGDSTKSITKPAYIHVSDQNIEPAAAFSSDIQLAKTDQPVIFTDESLYFPTDWLWYFGDGAISTKQNPTHAYKSTGTYTVSLYASNQYGSHSIVKTDYITVTQGSAPNADFSCSGTLTTGEAISFTDKTTNYPTSWIWDFGDGNTSNEQNPEHIYYYSGWFTVSLTATNSSGSSIEIKNNLFFIESDYSGISLNGLNDEAVQLFPNPSHGIFKLNVGDFTGQHFSFQVFDLTGNVAINKIIESGLECEIDLSNKPVGIYFLKLQSNNYSKVFKLTIN